MDEKTRRPLRTGARDPPLASRVIGVLYLAGGLLVLLSLLLPHPESTNTWGLGAIAGTGVAGGAASYTWARHARRWTVHVVLAGGTALVCLCIYFSGIAAGVYSAMFVWVVLVAASFLGRQGVTAHVLWVLLSWGLTLALVDDSSGFSDITRWTLGSFVLVVTAWVMHEIVAGRTATEERLQGEAERSAALQRELEHLAHHDPLTGLANRRPFEERLRGELARAGRTGAPLSLVALDLDQFKEYNDTAGHAAGDSLLKLAAAAWTHGLRTQDLIARLGGDEFVALLPDCPPGEAERVTERLCRAVPRGCTCSRGIAHWDGHESADELLLRADQALYEAKRHVASLSF